MNAREIINQRKEIVSRARPEKLLHDVKDQYLKYFNRLEKSSIRKRSIELIGIHDYWFRMDDLLKRAKNSIENKRTYEENRLLKNYELLGALNPKNVLE